MFWSAETPHLRESPNQQPLLDVLFQLIKTWPLTIGPCACQGKIFCVNKTFQSSDQTYSRSLNAQNMAHKVLPQGTVIQTCYRAGTYYTYSLWNLWNRKVELSKHEMTIKWLKNIELYKSTLKIRMIPRDQHFCDENFAKITLGIKIIWKFISKRVKE